MHLTNNPFQGLSSILTRRPGDAMPSPVHVERGIKGAAAKANARFPVVPNPWNLSPAQCAVLQAILENYVLRDAALVLAMSHRTVETHMDRVRTTMKAVNTMHAVLMWDRHWREQKEAE
jgi:DNA-binding NarL/FixJ family response regulator